MNVRTDYWQTWSDPEMGTLPAYWQTTALGWRFGKAFITFTKPTPRQLRRFKKEAKRHV